MLTNRKTQLLGMTLLIAAATLITISAIRVPASADLSWPPRPDFSVLNGAGPASARFDTELFIPLTDANALSDYYERHREQNEPAGIGADMSDYALRHPELNVGVGTVNDMSDYALRHPELNVGAGTVNDMSDYSSRHPELFQGNNAIDTSDYFLRH